MNKKILSIAIPTYNMELYLSRCVNSIFLPSILSKIEIIIVNDGSKDASLSIAQSYAEKAPDSVVVIDKPNGNYGSCINAALKIARGKYFRILDADDWFDSDNFVRFVNRLDTLDADMAVTNFSKEYSEGYSKSAVSDMSKIPSETVCDFTSFDFEELGYGRLVSMHSLTYRTNLLRDMDYRQTEGISYTDTEYSVYPLTKVKNFVLFDYVLYRYYLGREGQTVSDTALAKNKMQFYQVTTKILDHLRENKDLLLDKTVKKQQCLVLRRVATSYYLSSLVFNERNDADNTKLLEVDTQIKEIDKDSFSKLAEAEIWGVKYIHEWREKGIYFSDTNQFQLTKFCVKLRKVLKKNSFLVKLHRLRG